MKASPHSGSLTDLATIQAYAKRSGFRPSKERSQNFLLDRSVLHDTLQAAQLSQGDQVIEVGPGFGALTEALLAAGAHVTAVELDAQLAAALQRHFRSAEHFSLVVGDFFRWFAEHTKELQERPYSIVANLPYHLTSHFFQTVLTAAAPPRRVVVLIQNEVAERAAAGPGGMSLLTLSVQLWSTPRIVRKVPTTAFWPQPKVTSALLLLENIAAPSFSTETLFRCAKMAFAGRRKQIHNSLAAGLHIAAAELTPLLERCGIGRTARPQELSLKEWRTLADALEKAYPDQFVR